MLRDKAVWGLVISDIGNVFGLFIFVYYGPTYLNKVRIGLLGQGLPMATFQVLKIDVSTAGFATALPSLLALFMKFSAGPISDRLTFLSHKCRVKLFCSVSQVIGPAPERCSGPTANA